RGRSSPSCRRRRWWRCRRWARPPERRRRRRHRPGPRRPAPPPRRGPTDPASRNGVGDGTWTRWLPPCQESSRGGDAGGVAGGRLADRQPALHLLLVVFAPEAVAARLGGREADLGRGVGGQVLGDLQVTEGEVVLGG